MTRFVPQYHDWDATTPTEGSQHLRILRQGTDAWNQWRRANPYVVPFLTGPQLCDVNLDGADLSGSMLYRLALSKVSLRRANLAWAVEF